MCYTCSQPRLLALRCGPLPGRVVLHGRAAPLALRAQTVCYTLAYPRSASTRTVCYTLALPRLRLNPPLCYTVAHPRFVLGAASNPRHLRGSRFSGLRLFSPWVYRRLLLRAFRMCYNDSIVLVESD